MTKICIFGAGSIGGFIATSLKKTNAQVSLIARGEHKKAINCYEKSRKFISRSSLKLGDRKYKRF